MFFFNFLFGFICFFYKNFIFYNSFFAHICFYYENFWFFICFFFRILRFYISFYFLLLVFLRELTRNLRLIILIDKLWSLLWSVCSWSAQIIAVSFVPQLFHFFFCNEVAGHVGSDYAIFAKRIRSHPWIECLRSFVVRDAVKTAVEWDRVSRSHWKENRESKNVHLIQLIYQFLDIFAEWGK